MGLFIGKNIVDTGFVAVGRMGLPGALISGTYGLLDSYVQSKPEYVPLHGSRAGTPTTGWSAVPERGNDLKINTILFNLENNLPPRTFP